MTSNLDTLLLTAALATTGAYMVYMIEKRRKDIRKTIQIVDLSDTTFWEGLRQYRDIVPEKV